MPVESGSPTNSGLGFLKLGCCYVNQSEGNEAYLLFLCCENGVLGIIGYQLFD